MTKSRATAAPPAPWGSQPGSPGGTSTVRTIKYATRRIALIGMSWAAWSSARNT